MFRWLFSPRKSAPRNHPVLQDMAFERKRARELRRIRDARSFTRRMSL